MSSNSDGPGYVYCIRKYYSVANQKIYIPLCKLGRGVWPPDRLAEATDGASTWHPEGFEISFAKRVPFQMQAESQIHEFFKDERVSPAFKGGGIEWFDVDVFRVRSYFNALKGDPVIETFAGIIRPEPVKRFVEPEIVAVIPNIVYEDWVNTVRNMSLDTAEKYAMFQKTHPTYPSIADINTGCYNNEPNYNTLVDTIFGPPRRQR